MSRTVFAGLGIILLALAAALYWLLPAYVLPPMDVTQRPARHHDPVMAAPPETSYVSIPLAFSVDRIKKLVRERLSGKILVDNIQIPKRDLRVSIQRNGSMALWVHDAELHLVLPIKFRTTGDLKAKGELTLYTRAGFNVSRDWQSQVDARSTFRWDKQPRVGVWPFRFRIGDILAPHIQLALDRGALEFRDKAAGLYNIRAIAEGGWERLHGPHPLDAKSQIWLTMQPRELYLEPISSDLDEVRLNMWMGGELGIAEGGEPPPAQNRPLPQLRHGMPPAKSVVLSAPYTVSYERMQASLGDALLDKPLALMSGRLVVRELDLYGSGPDVVLGLGLEGQRTGSPLPTRGKIYLTGTPEYNPEAGTLGIHRLRVTPASRNPLAHGSRWVLEEAQVWAAEIEQRMNWDTAGALEQHEQQLGRYFNRTIHGRFDLWGDINEITISGALPQASGVALQTQARGDLELLFVP